jgi:fructokinase
VGSDPPTIDLLAIGEVLVDLISVERVDSLRQASTFRRYLGGSPANLATNVARLGRSSAIIGKIGVGVFGQYLKGRLEHNGVNTNYLVMDERVHTSMVFVSQTSGTPDFEPRRDGDYRLSPEEVSEEAVNAAKIVHTSTWPISREPSRAAIRKVFQMASDQGKAISFDPNYSPVVWPDHREAQEVMRDIYRYVTFTKASMDDSHRFFGGDHSPQTYLRMYHELGPRTVVLTMGKDGSLVSEDGHLLGHLPARPVKVRDATGAGDAFWAGFLVAFLDGSSLDLCLLFAREVAELKLQSVGTLPPAISRQELYASLPDVSSAFKVVGFE